VADCRIGNNVFAEFHRLFTGDRFHARWSSISVGLSTRPGFFAICESVRGR
jgi:hypothetical protein